MTRLLKQLGYLVAYGALGAVLAMSVAYVVYLRNLPEPKIWQRAKLDAEFRAADAPTVKTLDDYRRIEERVFVQLREKVYDHIAPDDRRMLNRYSTGSLADPEAQVYALTQVIRARLDALATAGDITGMPPILAFQSAVDDTVSAPAVVDTLFRRLAPAGHELVVFDVNRYAQAQPLLRPGIVAVRDLMLKAPPQPFDLTVVTNESPRSTAVVALRRAAMETAAHSEPIGLNWPRDVFSLSHVAQPFAPDDPVYGAMRPEKPAMIFLGNVELHGERGLLALPVGDLIRLRHNPFNAYVDARIRTFLERSH